MERPKGAFCYYHGALFRRSISPQGGEIKLQAQLARRREDADAWLFEI
jgi:hypothetical protein